MTTVLTADTSFSIDRAPADREALWLPTDRLAEVTGFERKPEGLCRGGVCVPVEPASPLVRDDAVDVAALWRRLGAPVLHDQAGDVWLLGEAAHERAAALTSLEAPDFALAALAGATHRLSDHRGEKVLLVTGASW